MRQPDPKQEPFAVQTSPNIWTFDFGVFFVSCEDWEIFYYWDCIKEFAGNDEVAYCWPGRHYGEHTLKKVYCSKRYYRSEDIPLKVFARTDIQEAFDDFLLKFMKAHKESIEAHRNAVLAQYEAEQSKKLRKQLRGSAWARGTHNGKSAKSQLAALGIIA